jgi:Protein of unknown function (DUF3618)
MNDVTAAHARVAAARARLSGTVETLQTRLDPRTIARDTVESIADSGERAIRNGVDTARRNPGLIAGAAALVGLWLARDKVKALVTDVLPKRAKTPKPASNPRVRTTRPRPMPVKRKPS